MGERIALFATAGALATASLAALASLGLIQPACSTNFNCSALFYSDYGKFFGIPIALFGVFAQVALFLLILRRVRGRPNCRLDLVLSQAIVAVVLGLVLYASTVLQVLCPYCLLHGGLSAIALFALASSYQSSSTGGKQATRTLSNLAVGAALLVVVFPATIEVFRTRTHVGIDLDKARRYEQESGRSGGQRNAKLVLFTDFGCGACAQAFRTIDEMQLLSILEIRVYPLSLGGVNHLAAIAYQSLTDESDKFEFARSAYNATLKGKLTNQQVIEFAGRLSPRLIAGSKLKIDPRVEITISRNLALGKELRISGVPSGYWIENGRFSEFNLYLDRAKMRNLSQTLKVNQ